MSPSRMKPVGLTNAELPAGDRPAPAPAPGQLPDIEPAGQPWQGSAGGRVEHWRERALRAEAQVQELRVELRKAMGALSDAVQTIRPLAAAEDRLVQLLARQT